MEFVRRPNRSDIHLSKEDEAKIEGETREYFDNLAPKHHTKPQRSEYASEYVDALDVCADDASELQAFQRLQKDTQV